MKWLFQSSVHKAAEHIHRSSEQFKDSFSRRYSYFKKLLSGYKLYWLKVFGSYSLCCVRVQFDVKNDLKPVYYEIGLEPKWSTNFAAVEEDDFVCVAILHSRKKVQGLKSCSQAVSAGTGAVKPYRSKKKRTSV